MTTQPAAERRAQKLVRLYPPAWRARYGDELLMLLADDISERPRSLSRTADILRSVAVARLQSAGLTGDALEGEAQVRTGLGTLALTLVTFLLAAGAVWSQLTIGWQWAAPGTHQTQTAMILLSGAMAAFAVVVVMAVAPIGWTLVRELVRGDRGALLSPLLCLAVCLFVLVDGSRYFGHGWPGTGGHPWAGRDLVPAMVARVCWAATLWVSAYWAHPRALSSFPPAEVIWMFLSPLALLTAVVSSARIVRRLPLGAKVLRYEARIGGVAAMSMAAAVAGACCWLLSRGPDPHGLFRAGAIDAVAALVMAASLLVGFRAAQRALTASRPQPEAT